ncbi:hypothetical protein CRG98_001846 [Punica granatum]|uniref:Uncharacterized protein n=1 Tax=Punica granatum TaxID=22663 RepID=A0A2I0LAL2_PUNGR|nr:hypothetical protein CRG98_001846 [Punica granatum]
MARHVVTRGRSSRPPTPHDRRVVPTFAGKPPAAFTLPPWQAPWDFNIEFPPSLHNDRKQIRVTALQRPALFLSIDLCFCISCTFLSGLHLLLLAFGPASDFNPAFTAVELWPRIYCIGLRPRIGLRPCIGLWPHILLLSGFSSASGFSPSFTALSFGIALGFGFALGFGLAFTASGFGPASDFGPAWASALHLLLSSFGPASGLGPAFTAFRF